MLDVCKSIGKEDECGIKKYPLFLPFFALFYYLIVTRPVGQISLKEDKALIASTPLTLGLNPRVQKVTDVCRPTKEKRSYNQAPLFTLFPKARSRGAEER